MSYLGTWREDDDPRVQAVKQEYEAWYLTPDGQAIDNAATMAQYRALPAEVKDHAADLSRRLYEVRMRVRADRMLNKDA